MSEILPPFSKDPKFNQIVIETTAQRAQRLGLKMTGEPKSPLRRPPETTSK